MNTCGAGGGKVIGTGGGAGGITEIGGGGGGGAGTNVGVGSGIGGSKVVARLGSTSQPLGEVLATAMGGAGDGGGGGGGAAIDGAGGSAGGGGGVLLGAGASGCGFAMERSLSLRERADRDCLRRRRDEFESR